MTRTLNAFREQEGARTGASARVESLSASHRLKSLHSFITLQQRDASQTLPHLTSSIVQNSSNSRRLTCLSCLQCETTWVHVPHMQVPRQGFSAEPPYSHAPTPDSIYIIVVTSFRAVELSIYPRIPKPVSLPHSPHFDSISVFQDTLLHFNTAIMPLALGKHCSSLILRRRHGSRQYDPSCKRCSRHGSAETSPPSDMQTRMTSIVSTTSQADS
jgi:hypothetical protein